MGRFARIWIKKRFAVIRPFRDCQQVTVENVSTFILIPNYSKKRSVICIEFYVRTLDFNSFGKLLIQTRKRSGPSIEPCGTPAKTGFRDQFCLFKISLWNLLES